MKEALTDLEGRAINIYQKIMQNEVALSIGDPDQQDDSEESNSIEKGDNNGEDEDYGKLRTLPPKLNSSRANFGVFFFVLYFSFFHSPAIKPSFVLHLQQQPFLVQTLQFQHPLPLFIHQNV